MSTFTTMQRAVALGASSLAFAASPALAQPDYQPPTTHVTQSPAGAAVHARLDLRSPDAVDAATPPTVDLRSPDAVDAAGAVPLSTSSLAGTTSATPAISATTTTQTDDGLDWGAITIGAGAILAVSLIGVGAVALTHRGRMRTAR